MLIALLGVRTAVKANARPGSQQAKGELVGLGVDRNVCAPRLRSRSPNALRDPRETSAATDIPAVQPYLWVAEGVLQVVQVVPCPSSLASCLRRYPATGALLKADVVVVRCASPQS